ncbi:MAG TPA: hypothetical protein PKD00_05905 [Burkholderiales bacterium]|nr:hypothetical protein [Burkholderiales bacterium]
MFKYLTILLTLNISSVFAISKFQNFDNEFNLGYGIYQTTLSNGAHNQTLQQNQIAQLEVERLFDIGVWLDVKGSLVTASNSLGNMAAGTGQERGILSQDFNLGGINSKVGYAFEVVNEHLQLIPYGQMGLNTNLAMSTVINNNQQNITNDFFYTLGIGLRLEYRISNELFLFADQVGNYNWDQSGPVNGIQPQNNIIYTSTIGIKYNACKNLQLGLNGFYNNYQYKALAPTIDSTGTSIYQPQYNVGGMFTVGLTY